MNYTVIAWVIFVLGCAGTLAWRRWRRTRAREDLELALGLQALQNEAEKARDKWTENQRSGGK